MKSRWQCQAAAARKCCISTGASHKKEIAPRNGKVDVEVRLGAGGGKWQALGTQR